MKCTSDIPGSKDVCIPCARSRIDDDTVVNVQTGVDGQLRTRARADRREDGVGLDDRVISQADTRGTPGSTGDFGNRGAEPQVCPVVAMQCWRASLGQVATMPSAPAASATFTAPIAVSEPSPFTANSSTIPAAPACT